MTGVVCSGSLKNLRNNPVGHGRESHRFVLGVCHTGLFSGGVAPLVVVFSEITL